MSIGAESGEQRFVFNLNNRRTSINNQALTYPPLVDLARQINAELEGVGNMNVAVEVLERNFGIDIGLSEYETQLVPDPLRGAICTGYDVEFNSTEDNKNPKVQGLLVVRAATLVSDG